MMRRLLVVVAIVVLLAGVYYNDTQINFDIPTCTDPEVCYIYPAWKIASAVAVGVLALIIGLSVGFKMC